MEGEPTTYGNPSYLTPSTNLTLFPRLKPPSSPILKPYTKENIINTLVRLRENRKTIGPTQTVNLTETPNLDRGPVMQATLSPI